jgi:predicted ArsR family transcriptional regulator
MKIQGTGVRTVIQTPDVIRTLNYWGADMQPPPGQGGNWFGDCPLCGKERKFFCEVSKTLWDCKVCGASGNHVSFIEAIYKSQSEYARERDWNRLSVHRKIPVEALKRSGIGYDGKHWLFPGHSARGVMHDIRRYDEDTKTMMSTAGCKTQLWRGHILAAAREGTRVWLCEGEWDAIAMMWLLHEMKNTDDVVVAVPGANVFKADWAELFRGKAVMCLYDADTAGEQGADKALKYLNGVARALKFINWPQTRPDGYDTRDHIVDGMKAGGPALVFKSLVGLLKDEPRHHDAGSAVVRDGITDPMLGPDGKQLVPATLEEVISTFKEHILLTEDLELALVVSLAICMSNDIPGDPVWLYIVGPPGAGKTMILSALANTRRCIFRSSVTPHCLVSGWKDGGPSGDPSLVPKLKGLTFVAKDFTEVLSLPTVAQEEIFSTLRGAYDGYVQKTFGNGVTREYMDCHFSMISGVTNAIHGNRQASLGERFLKLQVAKLEGTRAEDVIASAIASVGIERKMEDATKLVVSRFLARKIDPTKLPEVPNAFVIRLTALVQLVAMLRAQVEREKYEKEVVVYRPTPENGTRLAKQLIKLGISVAAMLEKTVVDDEVYAIMERVAMDTAHGFNLEVIDAMMALGGVADRTAVVEKLGVTPSTIYRRFDDLALLGAIIARKKGGLVAVGRPSIEYTVNKRIQQLWMSARTGTVACPTPKTAKTKKRVVIRRKPLLDQPLSKEQSSTSSEKSALPAQR